ncbi:phage tail protein [Pectobacterium versatile]|uniref:phage tail protein n=1 Tax=Pectobacterium versatile TaxID=2488639 RepID=UPI001CCDD52D|nr:tail fiber protein [Pectobacterium versatile]
MKCVQRLFAKSAITAALGVGFFLPQSALACSESGSQYLGSVCYMATQYCPDGYTIADGRILNVSNNQALYSLIGNLYGGTQPSTFALPNLQGRTVVGSGVFNSTAYPVAKTVGQDIAVGTGSSSVTLTAPQIPPHTHPATFSLNAASPSVSLPLSGSIANLPFNAAASLSVTGIAKIGSSTTTGRNINLTDKALLTSVGGPSALIYAPAGATNDRQLGPDGSVTGTATGNISSTASGGQLAGNATGPLTLPVTGSVSVNANVTQPAPVVAPVSVAVPVRDPSLVLTACIATQGLYPVRPD